ncbi:hypothetical protein [Catellatospora vulcania]|uniref:hypothetical protein n=1 Tax=Catellatospora vulcania TaxID=1460450 RepID=UPI0012D41F4B|nr:hypothetical protein [Catellatospora vulcania]
MHRRDPPGQAEGEFDDATQSWWTVVDRWHVRFCDLSSGQGLLGQVEGRTAQVVADWTLQVEAVA